MPSVPLSSLEYVLQKILVPAFSSVPLDQNLFRQGHLKCCFVVTFVMACPFLSTKYEFLTRVTLSSMQKWEETSSADAGRCHRNDTARTVSAEFEDSFSKNFDISS